MIVPTRHTWPALGLTLALALTLAGCDQPTGSTRPRARAMPPPEQAAPAPAPPEAPAPREFIVGKTTQDIKDLDAAKKAGGVIVEPKITAKDYITLQGNAYVSMVGKTQVDRIKHAIDLYQAETGEFPKTKEEFMDKIIKANNIVLPKLPEYQDYSYVAEEHKLVIIEYSDKKKAP
jgi:hypothetical protein